MTHNTQRARRLYWSACGAILTSMALACGTDSPVATEIDQTGQFWNLRMTQRAVTLATTQTLQLTAVPLTAAGTAIASLPAPTFTSTDTTKVTVDATGLIRALATTTSTSIIASLTVGGVTAADTVVVAVTPATKAFKSLSVQPADSTKLGMNASKNVAAVAKDSSAATITGLAVRYWTSDETIARMSSTFLVGMAKGTVWLYASTTSYGVTSTDSVAYTITNPVSATMYYYGGAYPGVVPFNSDTVIVGVNAKVTFTNYSGGAMTLTFPDSTNVTGGNIPSLGLYASAIRQFTVAGQYVIQDTASRRGLIVVLPP